MLNSSDMLTSNLSLDVGMEEITDTYYLSVPNQDVYFTS
nr:MAG TPA: hypothetical protein [Caudoviricetes sp.]